MTFLTEAIAEKAIRLTVPFIAGLVRSGTVKRDDLYVHVAVITAGKYNHYTTLASRSFGDPNDWEHPYDEIAHGKTSLTARTGLTSREVQAMCPELLEDGDVKFWGNAIVGNIVVSCSGVQPWFDELISFTVARLCQALVQQLVEDMRAIASDDFFNS